MRKAWLAIDLEDFHSPSKKWQGRIGQDTFVQCKVVGGKNLTQALKNARTDDGRPWYVVGLGTVRSMVYGTKTPEDQLQ